MHLAKLFVGTTPSGNRVVMNICITDAAWNKCNLETQTQVEKILQDEPIRIMAAGEHGKGMKYEPDHWCFHTQTGQRLATTTRVEIGDLTLQSLDFDRVYNH
jgi:hypothetical protein